MYVEITGFGGGLPLVAWVRLGMEMAVWSGVNLNAQLGGNITVSYGKYPLQAMKKASDSGGSFIFMLLGILPEIIFPGYVLFGDGTLHYPIVGL